MMRSLRLPVVRFLGGRLWTFAAKTLPVRVGVFCPKAVRSPKELEVLVYAHGQLAPCKPVPRKMPGDLITKAPFRAGQARRCLESRDRACRPVSGLG